MEVQNLVNQLMRRGIIAGPDHFVLGDGFGNPGRHCSLFVVPEKFYLSHDIHEALIGNIVERLRDMEFDLIIVPDVQSLAVAKVIAGHIERNLNRPPMQVLDFKTDDLPDSDRPVLIHDDVITPGKQATEMIQSLRAETRLRPVAISTVFSRIPEMELDGLPILPAVDRVMAGHEPDQCPYCAEGMPVNVKYGKGLLFRDRMKAGR